ncbi:MAG: metalloregulator ArsR/SmtB family transcription factor [Leptospiraceae bacterium]|nr:metalloregulator ArsR/SmtB family transcription factor [Leptospiraceae bacterium]MCP5497078.1 metalloregulator ArsR/SmtB family transcription factor [Leptospiraceae bacterium]
MDSSNSKTVINTLKAVSDEVRLRILNILLNGTLNVNEVQEVLKMGQSRVSRHLKILENADLIVSQREGTWIYYKLKESPTFGYGLLQYLFSCKNEIPYGERDKSNTLNILQKRQESSNRFFNQIGKNWEKIQNNVLNPEVYRDRILSLLPETVKLSIDLGCGPGGLIPFLLTKSEKVIGVDVSQKMLTEAKSKFQEDPRVEIIESNIEHLPLSEEIANVAIASMVLHHVSNPLLVMNEVYRVLQSEGLLFIIELKKHNQEFMRDNFSDLWLGFQESTLTEWLKTAGFSVLDQIELNTFSIFQIIIIKAIKKGGQNVRK